MQVLSIDFGSTQWKAAIGTASGLAHVCKIPAPFVRHANGYADTSIETFKKTMCALIAMLPEAGRAQVRALSLTGMAEGGLLMAKHTMQPLTPVVPWYDIRPIGTLDTLRAAGKLDGRAAITGLPASYKYGVFRLLDWAERLSIRPDTCLWIDVIAYAALLLTGSVFTVPTLAARSYAYSLADRQYDAQWLCGLGLDTACLAPIHPEHIPPAVLAADAAKALGLPSGIPVYIAGHDHLCAAYGAGTLQPGGLYGSMGTAMTLIGSRPHAALSPDDVSSGLSFGPSPAGEGLTVLGSIQSAGGSIQWLKDLLYPAETYEAMLESVATLPPGPSGLLYYPYLAGSGAPHLDLHARGSFIGLDSTTSRERLVLAAYEGIAMESRFILSSMALAGTERIVVSGGLTAHTRLLQCLADILRVEVAVSGEAEGSLFGAACIALRAQGQSVAPAATGACYAPSADTQAYDSLYTDAYLPAMAALEIIYPRLKGE